MQNAGMNAVISGKYIISDFFYMKVKSQGHQVKMVPIERSCKVICGNMKAHFFMVDFFTNHYYRSKVRVRVTR